MADRRSLGILGFLFGGVTVAVMLTAVVVVKNSIDSRTILDSRVAVLASAQS